MLREAAFFFSNLSCSIPVARSYSRTSSASTYMYVPFSSQARQSSAISRSSQPASAPAQDERKFAVTVLSSSYSTARRTQVGAVGGGSRRGGRRTGRARDAPDKAAIVRQPAGPSLRFRRQGRNHTNEGQAQLQLLRSRAGSRIWQSATSKVRATVSRG